MVVCTCILHLWNKQIAKLMVVVVVVAFEMGVCWGFFTVFGARFDLECEIRTNQDQFG